MKRIILTLSAIVLMSCSFAQSGAYLEFNVSSSQNGITGTMKVYSADGNTRSEMQTSIPKMPGGGINTTSLILKDNPDKIYLLSEKSKTYSEMDKSKSTKKDAEGGYDVTVLGKEKVNGYNSTHVKVKQNSSGHETEMWLSTDLPNFEKFKSVGTDYTDDYLYRALAVKGVNGFPVRIVSNMKGRSMELDLQTAEVRSNPSSLFSLDGYTKSASPGMPGGNMPSSQDIQKMTPEQRQQMIDQLKQQYGAPK